MNRLPHVPNFPAARNVSSGVLSNNSPLAALHLIIDSTVCAFLFVIKSILLAFIGNPASMNVYHTKEVDYFIIAQSGEEKSARRDQYLKSSRSKAASKKKMLEKHAKKAWTEDTRRKYLEKKVKHSSNSPHSGVEGLSLDDFRALASLQGLTIPEEIFSNIEGLGLLAAALGECHSATQALSIFLLYLKTHYSKSLVETGAELFSNLFSEEELVPHSGLEKPLWLSLLRDGLTNWRLAKTNPAFKKVSYLISICITLGLCKAANFEWKIGNVKAFCIPALERHFGAFDLLDAAAETVMYFVEGGYACFQTGSFTPFLFSDHRAKEFEDNYVTLITNMEHVKTGNLRSATDMDEHMYDLLLANTITDAAELNKSAQGTWEKKILFDRLTHLRKIRATFDAVRVKGGLREAPFCTNFFGKSGVGKSSVSAISMVVGLLSNGFGAEDEMMATLNESDKFMSNYRSFVSGIFIDDIGNTKPDFVEKSPVNKVIEICNNVRQYANMAEADMKGKISIEPKFVNLTTNVKSLCAHTYSNEPGSIARRAHLTVTVKVRPEFCAPGMTGAVGQQLDSDKVAAHYTTDGVLDIPLIPDLWLLTVERVVLTPSSTLNSSDTINYQLISHKDQTMKDISLRMYLDLMIDMSRNHFINQASLVERSNNLASRIEMCPCGKPCVVCDCPDVVPESEEEEIELPDLVETDIMLEPQNGYLLGAVAGQIVKTKYQDMSTRIVSNLKRETSILEKMTTVKLLEFAELFDASSYFQWTNYIPRDWLLHYHARSIIEYAMRDEVVHTVRRESFAMLTFVMVLIPTSLLLFPHWAQLLSFSLSFVILHRVAIITQTVKERIYLEICQRNDAMPHLFKKVRDTHSKYILYTLGAAAGLYTLLKMFQGFRNSTVNLHGNLQPSSMEEIDARDAEVNPWASVNLVPPPSTPLQKVMIPNEALNRVHKNQVFMRVTQGTTRRVSGGYFLFSNLLLMPHHMWYENGDVTKEIEEDIYVEFTHAGKHTFEGRLSIHQAHHIPNTDFVAVWVPNGGEWANNLPLLPVDAIKSGPCKMVFRNGDSRRIDAHANIDVGVVGHSGAQFMGARYQLSIPTFNGLCMATFVSESTSSYIAGFHLGGRTGEAEGVLGTITLDQALSAIKVVAACEGVLLCKSAGTLLLEQYGIRFYTDSDVHYKSPVNFMEHDSNMRVHGSVIGKSTAKSNVVDSLITESVHKHTGVPQKWGKPHLKPAWKPFQESLKYSSRPSVGIEGSLLAKAVKDYKEPLLELIHNTPGLKDDIRPLTKMEVVCGRDGKRFIDKMKASTACGFPLTGPKSEYMTLLDPEQHPEHAAPVELDPMFWEAAEQVEKCYLEGERTYPVFKACLKDEPTPLEKEKVRVFQSAPLVLQLLTRKYFLPVARVLSLYPLISECAVGINCQGPEWTELQDFITKYGEDRILAGDYSKYDLRMPAQISLASFRILIDLAEASGNYSEDDLSIMRGLASDICYPMVAYDGTLIQLIGSNPSGQGMTVYINGVGNSLCIRCGFFEIVKPPPPPKPFPKFREVVALATYGDDAKSSVKKGYDEFNHISLAKFLGERDMVFTMPDKTSTPIPFMKDADCDFLKRKNKFNEETGFMFGALDEDSIFKSLHAGVRSKFLSPKEQSIATIGGALREWFAYGEEVYEMRRAQMQLVAADHDIISPDVSIPYAARVETWKDKYLRVSQ